MLVRRHMNWMEKVAKIPATLDDNRLPRKLLGAWSFGGKRRRGGQLKTKHNSYLDLLRKLNLMLMIHLIQLYAAPTVL